MKPSATIPESLARPKRRTSGLQHKAPIVARPESSLPRAT